MLLNTKSNLSHNKLLNIKKESLNLK